jgi:PKD repeat protein
MKNMGKSMARKGILALAIVFALVATVSALSIPPVVQITATPNPAQVTSTITAVAVDLSGTGIAWTKIYEDGVQKKECSTSTCVYVSVHASLGTHTYYAKTSDNGGRTATSSTISVNFVNAAPILNPIGEKNVTNGTLLQFQISGYDYNNDPLTYSASGVPAGATFNATSRTFSWTPTTAQIGVYYINFSVSDGYLSDSELVTINVLSSYLNHAPVLDPIGNKAGTNNSLLQFTINGSDIDGDALTFSASGLPSGAAFNATSRTFSWTPTIAQIGIYNVNFSVSDGQLSDSEMIMINITSSGNYTNHAPVLDSIGAKSIYEGQLLQFTINGSDIDGDALTFLASGLPAGATFNATSRTFSWIPNFTQAGTYNVNFSVSDGSLSDSELVTITVNDAVDTGAPKYSNLIANPASPANYAEDASYEFNATWIDDLAVVGAWIEFDGANYSASKSGDVYSFVINDIAPRNYSYRWFATDMAGNFNSTGIFVYTINKGTPSLSIEMQPSSSVDNGTETNVSGFGCPAQLVCKLYRDGAEVTNPDIQTLDIGSYQYIFNTTGNENYTAASITRTLSVIEQGHNDNNDNNNSDVIVIDDNDFSKGYYVTMDVGDKLKFDFCGAPYYIKLTETDTDDDKAYFLLTPLVETIILKKHQSQEIDLNGDGVNDILFRVESVTSDTARVYIKRISTTCAQPTQESGLQVYTDGNKLKPAQEAATGFMDYIAILLMFGILLLALAILLYLIDRMKRMQRKPVGTA